MGMEEVRRGAHPQVLFTVAGTLNHFLLWSLSLGVQEAYQVRSGGVLYYSFQIPSVALF